MVGNPPAKQETSIRPLGREDPLKEGMGTHSSTIARKSHGQGSLVGYIPWSCKQSDMTEHICMHILLESFSIIYLS